MDGVFFYIIGNCVSYNAKKRSAKDASRRARKIAAFWQHAPRAESVASDTLFYWMNPIKCGTLYAVY